VHHDGQIVCGCEIEEWFVPRQDMLLQHFHTDHGNFLRAQVLTHPHEINCALGGRFKCPLRRQPFAVYGKADTDTPSGTALASILTDAILYAASSIGHFGDNA